MNKSEDTVNKSRVSEAIFCLLNHLLRDFLGMKGDWRCSGVSDICPDTSPKVCHANGRCISYKWEVHVIPTCGNSNHRQALLHKHHIIRSLGTTHPPPTPSKTKESRSEKATLGATLGERQSIAQKGVRTIDARNSQLENGSNALKTSVRAPGLSTDEREHPFV